MKGKQLLNLAKLLIFASLMLFVVMRISFRSYAAPHAAAEGPGTRVDLRHIDNTTKSFDWQGEEVVLDVVKGEQGTSWRDREGRRWRLTVGFLHRLAHMDLTLLFLGALAYFLCASFSSLRWRWLLTANGLSVSIFEAWRLTWIGIFFNNVVPGLTGGDLIKAYYIARHTGKKTVPILTVIVDRILGLAALATLALIVVLWNLGHFSRASQSGYIIWGIPAVLAVVAFITVLFLSRRIRRALHLSALMRRLPFSGLLMQIDSALTFYRTRKLALTFWFIASVANHLLSTGFIVVLGIAMGLRIPLADYFVLVPVINIASAAPIAPAGWGVGEALYDFCFTRFSVLGPGEGAGLSAVSRVVITVLSLLGGVLLLGMKDRVSTRVIEEEMHQEDEACREKE